LERRIESESLLRENKEIAPGKYVCTLVSVMGLLSEPIGISEETDGQIFNRTSKQSV